MLAWRLSNTLEAEFCVEALNEAIHRFGAPGVDGWETLDQPLAPESVNLAA